MRLITLAKKYAIVNFLSRKINLKIFNNYVINFFTIKLLKLENFKRLKKKNTFVHTSKNYSSTNQYQTKEKNNFRIIHDQSSKSLQAFEKQKLLTNCLNKLILNWFWSALWYFFYWLLINRKKLKTFKQLILKIHEQYDMISFGFNQKIKRL